MVRNIQREFCARASKRKSIQSTFVVCCDEYNCSELNISLLVKERSKKNSKFYIAILFDEAKERELRMENFMCLKKP